jgi:hypothetical protein
MEQEKITVDRALAHLKHLLWACNTAMEPWVENDESIEGEEKTWEHRYTHLRRILLQYVNNIIDEYGPPDDPKPDPKLDEMRKLRASHLWDVYSIMLESWGIIRTEDQKAFTFIKEDGPTDAG